MSQGESTFPLKRDFLAAVDPVFPKTLPWGVLALRCEHRVYKSHGTELTCPCWLMNQQHWEVLVPSEISEHPTA